MLSNRGRVSRSFDINYDGLAHFSMIPDFLQEMKVLGANADKMGAIFRSAEGLIAMWEENCFLAYQMEGRPASLPRGCGPEKLYD